MNSTSKGSNTRPTKRRRTDAHAVQDDIPTPQAQASAPSATALSVRVLPPSHVPTLVTLCIRAFAKNLQKLSADEAVWESVRSYLKALPDSLVSRVFSALKSTCPTILSNGLIVANFIRGTSVALDNSLLGVNRHTIASIRDSTTCTTLRELRLSDFEKEPDSLFASVVSKLPSLQVLVLRGCTKVGQKTLDSIAKSCPRLVVLNLNYTSALPVFVAPVLLACRRLEVLKAAGISNWTDAAFAKLHAILGSQDNFQLPELRTLKLRQTALSDNALSPFLSFCPNLKRVDLSFTLVRHPSSLLAGKSLEKLSLTSTKITGGELLAAVFNMPDLVTLNIGALGGGQGSSAAISNSSAMSMTDQTLRDLTDIVEKYTRLERVNLVGNTKLEMTGKRDSAIADFIRRVGRRCTILNLANISSLRSSDLEGLVPDTIEDESAKLQVLTLNNTAVDDDASHFIASCRLLETLSVGGTRFTNEGLYAILDACPKLQRLDLTSCRGVRVGDRRRFFEVWEQERGGKNGRDVE